MAHYILFDDFQVEHLRPLTSTRPACELRLGIWRIRQKWEHYLGLPIRSFLTRPALRSLYPLELAEVNYLINGRVMPNADLLAAIRGLPLHHALYQGDTVLALKLKAEDVARIDEEHNSPAHLGWIEYQGATPMQLSRLPQAFGLNASALEADLACLSAGRESAPLPAGVQVLGSAAAIFIEPGAVLELCVLDTRQGSVYIGAKTKVEPGALLRGPLALCQGAEVKPGAKLFGPTTIGPYAKVGGELNNVIIQGFSNKGHEGFLGQAFVGEWCNLGADTNNSNLKNTYDSVKVWDYASQSQEDSGLQFCGLFLGDHAKSGINTMFNTGTVVGVGANVFGAGFPPSFVPDFAWGGIENCQTYRLDKFLDTAEKVMLRRQVALSPEMREMLSAVFTETAQFRTWEQAQAPFVGADFLAEIEANLDLDAEPDRPIGAELLAEAEANLDLDLEADDADNFFGEEGDFEF